jgi:hypothetical protein
MSTIVNLDAIRGVLPSGLPVSVVGIIATILVGVVYSMLAQERPLAGFPLASVAGKSPRKSWLFHGRQLVTEALHKVASYPLLIRADPCEQSINECVIVFRPLPDHERDWTEDHPAQQIR